MNKKFLQSKYLFQMVKEFAYTYDIPMHHMVGSELDLKEHILDTFRNKMVKNLITTLQDANEILVPHVTELIQTKDPKRMCVCISQKLQFYKFILNVSEDVFNVPAPDSTFSIRGLGTKQMVADEDYDKPEHWRKY